MAIDNVFGRIKILADSNSRWIVNSQDMMIGLIGAIQDHLDNIEYVIKDLEKSDHDISDLENIYSIRLNAYATIIDFMTKINEVSNKEVEIQKKMYKKEYQRYKDVFESLKSKS